MTRDDDVLRPDICVVGGGSGGLSVAAGAAAFGVSTILVERGAMGGDCLNVGCVPSKALLAAGAAAEAVRRAPAFGIAAGQAAVDFAGVRDHVAAVVASIAPDDSAERFERLGVRVVRASARFLDARTIEAGGLRIAARRFVIAAGSSPRVPDLPGLAGVPYLTNETVFSLREAPEHLLVLGGGPVGMELAQAHRRLGCRVSLIEAGRALGREDPDLAAVVLAQLRREGVAILEGRTAVRFAAGPGGAIRLDVEGPDGRIETLEGSHLLLAAGRRPNFEGLGLAEAGIETTDAGIRVGADLRTTNRRVHAIGDIAGPPQFTHRANQEAGLVLRSILFRLPVRRDLGALPRVTFTDPELGQVGPTQGELEARGIRPTVLTFPFSANDRARAMRRPEGFVKLLVGRRGRLLGAGIVGEAAGETTNLLSLAVSQGLGMRELQAFVSPYPTLGEVGKRAATAYFRPQADRAFVRGLVRLLARFG